MIAEGPDAGSGTPTSYDGLWNASWAFHVDLINTGTTYARDCAFHGNTCAAPNR